LPTFQKLKTRKETNLDGLHDIGLGLSQGLLLGVGYLELLASQQVGNEAVQVVGGVVDDF
jgi:hypothetical protein